MIPTVRVVLDLRQDDWHWCLDGRRAIGDLSVFVDGQLVHARAIAEIAETTARIPWLIERLTNFPLPLWPPEAWSKWIGRKVRMDGREGIVCVVRSGYAGTAGEVTMVTKDGETVTTDAIDEGIEWITEG